MSGSKYEEADYWPTYKIPLQKRAINLNTGERRVETIETTGACQHDFKSEDIKGLKIASPFSARRFA